MSAYTRKATCRILIFLLACYTGPSFAQISQSQKTDIPSCNEIQNGSSSQPSLNGRSKEATPLGAPTLEERALYKNPNHKAWDSFNAAPHPLKPKLSEYLKNKSIPQREIMAKPPGLPRDIDINSIIRKKQLELNRGYKGSSLDRDSPSISQDMQNSSVFEWRNLMAPKFEIANRGLPAQMFNITSDGNLPSIFSEKEETAMHRLLQRDETQQIGLGATPAPGIYQNIKLPQLKTEEGLAIGNVDGVRCWRYAVPDDAEEVNPSTQTTNLAFDPFGFREIGALVIIYQNGITPKYINAEICSFVIIDAKYILTATHCLWKYNPQTKNADSVTAIAKQLLWLYPKKGSAAKDVLGCISADKKGCDFYTLDVKEGFHAPDLYHNDATDNWYQDIALVELAKPISDSDLKSASLPPLSQARSFYLPPGSSISIAGYGGSTYQDTSLMSESGNLGIAHQVLEGQFSYEFVWRKSIQVAVGGACFGDSGGPVYSGWTYGKDKEKHLVVGINSLIKLNAPTNNPSAIIANVEPSKFSHKVQMCVSGEMSNSAQLVSSALPWICQKTYNALPSCKL